MQGNDNFRLIVRRGPQPNQTYDLNKDIVTIGRDITNDIVINDPEVSRHHLRFTRGAGGFTIEDLGSTNGTFVNGQRITGAKPLNNGDMIGLGETVTLGYEASRGPNVGAPEEGGGMQQTMPSSAPPQPQPSSPYMQQPEQPSYASVAPDQPESPSPSPQQPSSGFAPSATPMGQTPPPQAPPGDYAYYDEEEPGSNNTMRIVLIGCLVLLVFCCCVTIVSAFLIDQNCMWYDLPIIGDILSAVGQTPPLSEPACARRFGTGL
ncbi:MAG: FHA domain-containing protein [Chloroflexota bacterium]